MAFGYFNPNPVFRPQVVVLADVAQGNPTAIATDLPHNYLTGTVVRLYIPLEAGMQQLAGGEQWEITVTGAATFTIPVDSTGFDPFVFPLGLQNQIPQVYPVGENTFILTMASNNIL